MKTRPIYLDDPYIKEMKAKIIDAVQEKEGVWRLILDETIFYPMGGGQPTDQGQIIFSNGSLLEVYQVLLKDGVLVVNGTVVSKGEAFLSFLKKTNFSPNKIIFIDDHEENLKSLEAALQKLDKPIDYHGLHFTGAQKYPSKLISEEEFESRWQELASKAKELN